MQIACFGFTNCVRNRVSVQEKQCTYHCSAVAMHRIFIIVVAVKIFVNIISAVDVQQVLPSLPYCPDKNESGLVLVSTLDGKLSALNSTGHLTWEIDTGPGPLLISNIHSLELTNNGEWVRIIPSLSGMLYKFDGATVDPIPISADTLLKSSFKYSDDLIIAGGIEVRTYGVGFRTGKLFYECTQVKCSTEEEQEVDDILLVERNTQTIRAVESRTGSERWNFSVGLHNIKLPRVTCIDSHIKLFDWNLTAVLPEGVLKASLHKNNVEHSWQYKFTAPIVRVWRWSGMKLTEINLFASKNIPNMVVRSSSSSPSIYVGMHKKQLYIHESAVMQNILHGRPNTNVAVTESTSIAKIPWKPVPASNEVTEDDSTALSVLNGSEYVNGNGYYLYSESNVEEKDSLLCGTNDSFIETDSVTVEETMEEISIIYFYSMRYIKELLLLAFTFVAYFLFRIWNSHVHSQEIIIIEKPVEASVTKLERKISEKENDTFTSRYINDFDTIRCLGKGGFGVVFEVKQKIDECYYAIKRITLPNEQQSRERVMREVKALAKLDHQNIVRYFCSWVEHPPLGWDKEHDKCWIEDKSSITHDEVSTAHTATQSCSKVKRSKSASVSIDIPLQKFDQETLNFDNEDQYDDTDDDSFIVFEKGSEDKQHNSQKDYSKDEIVNTTESDNSIVFEPHHSQNTVYLQHITFGEDTVKLITDSTVSSGIEMTNSKSLTEHVERKIDWKRPGRKHHSWDISQNNLIVPKLKEPPVYLYIQMQLCQKESLKEWLNSNYDRDYKMVLDIFSQILEAVEYVHLRGLIHRDLKPSNIFFSLEGQIKVGDFGLVKDMEDSLDVEIMKKRSPSVSPMGGHTIDVGTKLYMSPEQCHSHLYNYKVDIYSLGLIFFELLIPFSTDMERIKTLTDVKKDKYPEDFSEKFPHEYNLLKNMLCDDPNKRLTTIGVKARPPFNKSDPSYGEEQHYRLNNFQKN